MKPKLKQALQNSAIFLLSIGVMAGILTYLGRHTNIGNGWLFLIGTLLTAGTVVSLGYMMTSISKAIDEKNNIER